MAKAARRRLILHIGQTKAGSTAIQNYLDHERDALLKHGILFPSTGFSRSNPHDPDRTAGHLGLVRMLSRDDPLHRAELDETRAAEQLVLSAENLFIDRPESDLLALSRFSDGYELTLVLIVRSASAWFVSRYIEDVMSGFKSSTLTFQQACRERISVGVHDYAARLRYLCDILHPAQVCLINYDAASDDEGIIPKFLSATGLPHTNPKLARAQRSNTREHWDFLIEAKRRLNYTLQRLPLPVRLESEAMIRQAAVQIAATTTSSLSLIDQNAVFSEKLGKEIRASNLRLVKDFMLAPDLPEPCVGQLPIDRYRRKLLEADLLIAFGLKAAAKCIQKEELKSEKISIPTILKTPGCELLIEALEQSRVSVHLDSIETAVWAASYSAKLPILLTEKTTLAQADQLLAMRLPSEILLGKPGEAINLFLGRRPPNIIVAPVGIPIAMMASLWAATNRNAVLALVGHDLACANEIADRLDLTCQRVSGRVSLFAPRKHTA